jgi:hypothetical protein
VVDGESSEAGNPGTLGMTKRGGSLQGQGGCWMKQWLLNRRIFQIEFGQLFQPPCGTQSVLIRSIRAATPQNLGVPQIEYRPTQPVKTVA